MEPNPPGIGATAFGVPLMTGERVVHAHEMSHTDAKIACIVLAVLLCWTIVGPLVFIYAYVRFAKRPPHVQMVTNHRIVLIDVDTIKAGMPLVHHLKNIADVEPLRQSAQGEADVLEAMVSAANSMADKEAKTEEGHWVRAIGVILIDHNGERHKVGGCAPIRLGMFLAQSMASGGFDQLPTAAYRP